MNNKQHLCGFSLVELMVALIIGSFLIIGAVTVYVQSRTTYAVNETVSRMQENARYALSTLEPDIRLASYWGLSNDAEMITGAVGNVPLGGGTTSDCGAGFDTNVRQPIAGSNNAYATLTPLLGAPVINLGCAAATPTAPDPAFNRTPDTLVVRRADEQRSAATAGRLQVYTTRQGGGSQIFNSATAPGAPSALVVDPVLGAQAEIRNLVVRAYYVSPGSSQARTPSLRRKNLIAGPNFVDEEILPGVEDLQIQFGIDLGVDSPGAPVGFDDEDNNGLPDRYSGIATRYVNPGDPLLATAEVVAVRLWLLMRAETPEVGFVNARRFDYGDVVNYQPNDSFRRLLVSRTIQIRNTVNLQL